MCKILICLLGVTLLIAACGTPAATTSTPVPTADTRPAPTSTASPVALTITSVPPTATAVPPTATRQPTATPLSPLDVSGDSVIVFYSERDGNSEIYAMNADGTGLRRLTNDPAEDDSPAISPDGSRMVFLTSRHDPSPKFPFFKYEIYVMDIDGTNQRRLTTTEAGENHPAWSPDGKKIVFDADYDEDGKFEIYTMNADGTDLTRLTTNQANDQFADWSPDGAHIAFSSDRSGQWDIYVMDADGRNQRPLTDDPGWEMFPAWSPDGAQIAFFACDPQGLPRRQDIYVMNADGSNVRQLTTTSSIVDEDPAWSPDGRHITFQSDRDGNFEIYAMNLDDGTQRRLTDHQRGDFWPSWGPARSGQAVSFTLQKSAQKFDVNGTFQAGLGDLDGDGDLDAVLANPQTNNSQVWLNDGGLQKGTSGHFTNTGQRLTQYGHGVGVADFDHDGDLDAFIACHFFVTPSRVYLNDGQGNLEDTGQDLGDAKISGAELNLVDLNGDGNVDVHVMYYDPNGLPDKVYLNDGQARFTDSGLALDEETIAWGDLDGDGDVDYFGKRSGKGYVVMLNDGGVQGGMSGQFIAGWQMDDIQVGNGAIALNDFDGDGDLDALLANGFRTGGSYPTLLLWNDGSGQFTDSGQRLNETMGTEFGVGDLDADGDLDVFVSNFDLSNEVWLNDGKGQLLDSGLRLGANTDASTKPSLGDLDGDGDLDIFVGSLTRKPQIWLNVAVLPDL